MPADSRRHTGYVSSEDRYCFGGPPGVGFRPGQTGAAFFSRRNCRAVSRVRPFERPVPFGGDRGSICHAQSSIRMPLAGIGGNAEISLRPRIFRQETGTKKEPVQLGWGRPSGGLSILRKPKLQKMQKMLLLEPGLRRPRGRNDPAVARMTAAELPPRLTWRAEVGPLCPLSLWLRGNFVAAQRNPPCATNGPRLPWRSL
jgi:hypothetical protein